MFFQYLEACVGRTCVCTCVFSGTSVFLYCETVHSDVYKFLLWFSVPGQVLTAQAAVEAVISATTAREETKQSSAGEESIEGEPQAKRQNLGMDFSSLVKEAVFDSQQVLHMS